MKLGRLQVGLLSGKKPTEQASRYQISEPQIAPLGHRRGGFGEQHGTRDPRSRDFLAQRLPGLREKAAEGGARELTVRRNVARQRTSTPVVQRGDAHCVCRLRCMTLHDCERSARIL